MTRHNTHGSYVELLVSFLSLFTRDDCQEYTAVLPPLMSYLTSARTGQSRQHFLGQAAAVMPPPAVKVAESEKHNFGRDLAQSIGDSTHPEVRGAGAIAQQHNYSARTHERRTNHEIGEKRKKSNTRGLGSSVYLVVGTAEVSGGGRSPVALITYTNA